MKRSWFAASVIKYIEYECGNCLKLINHFKVDPGRNKQVMIIFDDYEKSASKRYLMTEIQLNRKRAVALFYFIMDMPDKEFQIDHFYQYGFDEGSDESDVDDRGHKFYRIVLSDRQMIDLKAPVITHRIG